MVLLLKAHTTELEGIAQALPVHTYHFDLSMVSNLLLLFLFNSKSQLMSETWLTEAGLAAFPKLSPDPAMTVRMFAFSSGCRTNTSNVTSNSSRVLSWSLSLDYIKYRVSIAYD